MFELYKIIGLATPGWWAFMFQKLLLDHMPIHLTLVYYYFRIISWNCLHFVVFIFGFNCFTNIHLSFTLNTTVHSQTLCCPILTIISLSSIFRRYNNKYSLTTQRKNNKRCLFITICKLQKH